MFTSSSQVENHHHHHHHHHQFFPYHLVPRPVVGDHNQRRWKPNVEIAPNCPRCNSSNTKFCYYNNYSLTQPRYFCKGCRRYWTKGGSLRNVPVGGGCRKSRRAKAVRSDSLRHHHRVSTTTTTTNYGPNSMGLGVSHDDASVNANSTNMNDNLNESNSCEPCNIDLALVYAKFLNQRPDHTTSNPNPNDHDHQHVISEFARDDNQFNSTSSNIATSSSVWEPNHNLDAHVQRFSQEQEFGNSSTDHEFNVHVEGKEFDLNYDQQPQERINSQTSAGFDEECSYALQPQELINGQDMFWSNSPLMGSSSFPWPVSQTQDFGSTIHPNLLDDNWSPFDLPSDEAFSSPSIY